MNMHGRKYVLLALTILLTASACSSGGTASVPTEPPPAPTSVPPTVTTAPSPTAVPTPTPEPVAVSDAACVVGVWEMSDLGAYMSSVVPSTSGSSFEFVGQEGYVRFIFGDDGTVAFEASDFVVKFAISVSGLSFDLDVTMNGLGAATYDAEADTMTIANSDVSDMTISGTLNGTELFSSSSGEMASLFGASAEDETATFPYTCSGDTLSYTPPIDQEDVQPVVLKRIAP